MYASDTGGRLRSSLAWGDCFRNPGKHGAEEDNANYEGAGSRSSRCYIQGILLYILVYYTYVCIYNITICMLWYGMYKVLYM